MRELEALRAELPDFARDIKVNLQAVLERSKLSAEQRWGTVVAAAVTSRNQRLIEAVVAEARREVDEAVVEDAFAAASLMAMNNVFYRFRHFVQKESYARKPAQLRMTRIAKPATNKADFELFCLAVSAVNGCEVCVRAHEKVVVEGGLSDDVVHDAARVAATVNAAAIALSIPAAPEDETAVA